MCGIAGIVRVKSGAPPVEEAMLWRMADKIAHRGPDDAGVYVSPDGSAGLVNRRLAIIDLSEAGHQPMGSEDGSVWIAYNGEVYNYADYHEELIASGHVLRSHSDTEVILHLYEEYGPDALHKLRGMFAFAIWDAPRRELFLARDRIGIKPLYYTFTGGYFIFASEIKAILEHPTVPRAVDEEAFYHFLSFLTVPSPATLFAGIRKLPPGHRAQLSANGNGTLSIEEYWDVFDAVERHADWRAEDYCEALLEKLRESIRLRMVSDVPFGVFLSGGIDSTANVALMDEQMDRPVQTFSVGYAGQDRYNEFEYARLAAGHYQAEQHEIVIDEDDLLGFLPKLIYHQDEPIADPVCVPLYYVARLARESGTIVVQVGEGADELFGGYTHWMDILRLHSGLWQGFNRLPHPLQRAALALAPLNRDSIRYEFVRRATDSEELFWSGAEAFGEVQKRRLVSPALRDRLNGLSSWEIIRAHRRRFDERSDNADYLTWMGYVDLRLRLPELLLMRVDKMTMATSVEARVPYLDHEFIGLVMGIPQSVRLADGATKSLFKRALRGLLPDIIIDRPKKGFAVPVNEWLNRRLGQVIHEKLTTFVARTDYFNPVTVQTLLDLNDYLTWYLFNFALWHELWIEGSSEGAQRSLESD
jgi:asparagine synthase (glutamine-hydrolysing)